MRAQAFSCLDVLPAVLSMCSFTGNDRDWAVEKPCFQSLQRYQESMEVNLIRFEQLLVELGQDAKTEHQRMLAEAYRCFYIMNSALADRVCLKAAIDKLKVKGGEFHEVRASNKDVQISNQKWLVRLRLTHFDCEALMQCMDKDVFRSRGDIVWTMPYDKEFRQVASTANKEKPYPVKAHAQVYVNFFDIGLQKDDYTRRMHLRVAKVDELTKDAAAALADQVRDVVNRCNAHARVLDWDQTGRDHKATRVEEAYDLSIWAGPYATREVYVKKEKPGRSGPQKRAQQPDWSAGSSRDWHDRQWSSRNWSGWSHGGMDY